MAEFDTTAFSAVDSFFVEDRSGVKESTTESKTLWQPTQNTRRLGVGAAGTPKPTLSAAKANKFLHVGKRKKRNQGDAEDDDDEEDLPTSDDEEEAGRTSIARDSGASAVTTGDTNRQMSKENKMKKTGKKERQKAKLEETRLEDTGNEQEDSADAIQTTNADSMAQPNGNPEKKSRRKRRKVRSRQKNIYKDKRSLDQKPDYLIPGSKNYLGRPITPETRQKIKPLTKKTETPTNSARTPQELVEMGVPVMDSGVPVVTSGTPDDTSNGARKMKHKTKYKNL